MRAILPILLLVLLALPMVEANPATARYVGGSYVRGAPIHGPCLGGDNEKALPGVGGVCSLVIEPGARVASVIDDDAGLRAFAWTLSSAGGAVCASGIAIGTVSLNVTSTCDHLSVNVEINATTGIVRVD